MNLRPALSLSAALLLAACGGHSEPEPPSEPEKALAAAPAATAETGDDTAQSGARPPAPADITLADLDAYERGMTAKTVEIQRATDELAQARADKNQDRELELMLYMSGPDLQARTAEASGLGVARYTAVSRILQDAGDRLASIQQLETMMLESVAATEDPDMRAQAEQSFESMREQLGDPFAGFTPEIAAALRERLPVFVARQREQAALMLRSGR